LTPIAFQKILFLVVVVLAFYQRFHTKGAEKISLIREHKEEVPRQEVVKLQLFE